MTTPSLHPAGAAKSPEAFRTISEVSDDLDLPQHVLRFWETRFAQIKPMKRGGGRRLYRPDHVALLRGIKVLLYEDGMTIKGVQKVLREQGAKGVIGRGRGQPLATLPDDANVRLDALRQRLGGRVGTAGQTGVAASIARLEAVLAKLQAQD